MYIVLALAVVIVIVVLLLSVITTSKAYSYRHTVDPIDNNPHLRADKQDEKKPHSDE